MAVSIIKLIVVPSSIASTAPKLSFHEHSVGELKIMVTLAGNDLKPLGPQETLTITIPQGKEGRAQR
jgi:hypothetical protein